jgi:hypothetical protein
MQYLHFSQQKIEKASVSVPMPFSPNALINLLSSHTLTKALMPSLYNFYEINC